MQKLQIGILHPGEMGISVAVSARNGGHQLYWVSEGRSPATAARAGQQGLKPLATLDQLCEECSVILSVCPPHAAEEVADSVIATGFHGLYLDGNAISPQRAIQIGERMAAAGITFVDGGIIGGPAWKPNSTWLYLSGAQAEQVAACFAAGPLETKVIGPTIGAASALKMCYAAYSKGTTALLAAILGAADYWQVSDVLASQWDHDTPNFTAQTQKRVQQVTAKAWRFAGEMEEISATLGAAGLPPGFHQAAAELYRRLAEFKDAPTTPSLNEVLDTLRVEPS
ncbi:MAG: DUF1932 domain-containing protein [Caldilineaceae bacterium]